MKVPDFLITASVNLIIAQRLSRRLCSDCKIAQPPSSDALKKIQKAFEVFKPPEGFDMNLLNDPILHTANKNGCATCRGKGFKVRVGIYEVLTMSKNLKEALLAGTASFKLEEIAKSEGMISLEQDGLIKALQGTTSIEEVYKLVKK